MRSLFRVTAGKIAALATVVVIVSVVAINGQELFSPGEMSEQSRGPVSLGGVTSHAQITDCAACHAAPLSGVTMASRCLDCHTDVKKQIDTKGPMHGRIADAATCTSCHTEHKGTHTALTNMKTFDHAWTAFKLTGKHRVTECQACHAGDAFTTPYKGVSQNCVSCHNEPAVHKAKFGSDCSECHTTSTWLLSTKTSLADFDHDQCAFKLTGKHTAVDCRSCHLDSQFKDTPQTCVACHAEPKSHQSRFGTNCVQCHSTTSWNGAFFKHTIFAIAHGQRGTANTCATCHDDSHHYDAYTCYNCHTHTPQNMAARHLRRNITDYSNCIDCHGVGKRRGGQGNGGAAEEVSVWDGTPDGGAVCPVSNDKPGVVMELGDLLRASAKSKLTSSRIVLDSAQEQPLQKVGTGPFSQLRLLDPALTNFSLVGGSTLARKGKE